MTSPSMRLARRMACTVVVLMMAACAPAFARDARVARVAQDSGVAPVAVAPQDTRVVPAAPPQNPAAAARPAGDPPPVAPVQPKETGQVQFPSGVDLAPEDDPDVTVPPFRWPKAPPKRTTRALWESAGLMSISMAHYWSQYRAFTEDWQFGLSWADQQKKFFSGQGLRFDSNTMQLNWTHAGAGAVYYTLARSNGLGAGVSSAFALGGSLIWEYVGEYREIASLNDIIYTGVGGVAIGEPLFQIGTYFRNRSGVGNRIATWLFNPIVAVNDLLDGSETFPRTPTDDWHDYRFSVGGRNGALNASGTTPAQTQLKLDMRLVTLPGYGKPGRGSGYARNPMDASFHVDLGLRNGAGDEFTIATNGSIVGWWRKDVRQSDDGRRSGYDMWLGVQLAWDMMQRRPIVPYDGHDLGVKFEKWLPRDQPTQFSDKISALHLPGPAFSITRYDGRLRSRLDLQASVDFGLVSALALNAYSRDHDITGVKTTLHNWGYYYAYGATAAARGELEYRLLHVQAGVDYRRYRSIQGWDRYQSDLSDDTAVNDSRLVGSASVKLRIPKSPVFSLVSVERILRSGRFHTVNARADETRVSYLFGVGF